MPEHHGIASPGALRKQRDAGALSASSDLSVKGG